MVQTVRECWNVRDYAASARCYFQEAREPYCAGCRSPYSSWHAGIPGLFEVAAAQRGLDAPPSPHSRTPLYPVSLRASSRRFYFIGMIHPYPPGKPHAPNQKRFQRPDRRGPLHEEICLPRSIFVLLQGDPLGDGTGGESIWGGEFEDEFHRNLRHDRPFTLSMANGGKLKVGWSLLLSTSAFRSGFKWWVSTFSTPARHLFRFRYVCSLRFGRATGTAVFIEPFCATRIWPEKKRMNFCATTFMERGGEGFALRATSYQCIVMHW